jgi:hypothetical protein
MSLTGSSTDSTLTDGSGAYTVSGYSGGNYTVTPSKAALAPASSGIDTIDVVAVQLHYLKLLSIPAGCRRTAADVTFDNNIDTVDAIAIQRFYLGQSTGIANTGKYKFTPANRTYISLMTNLFNENYDALIYGDVASSYVHLPETGPEEAGGSTTLTTGGSTTLSTSATVGTVSLPNAAVGLGRGNFSAAVTTTEIDARARLIGFQGDFTFDERMVRFQDPPAQNAGLTAGNWNVSANVLPGPGPAAGPIKTLRISAFSLDMTPLSGAGALFELKMTKVSSSGDPTQLLWVAPPNFTFIDAELGAHKPGTTTSGSVKAGTGN